LHIFAESVAWTCLSFVLWFLAFYLYHGLGITLGYHRLLTHKSLVVPTWLRYVIISGGYLGLMGSPIVWVAVHRLHHQKSDIAGDPHSPREGFKHALYGWMFTMKEVQSQDELEKQVPDLMADRFFRLLGYTHEPYQAQLCLAVSIVFRLLILCILGPIALVANILATATIFWSTQLVNAVCHLPSAGYRSHDTREDSRNVWWVGILALGEGWHNNHHAVPKSARHGFEWFEVDVTWYAVWLLEKIGLAKNIVRPPKFGVAKAPGGSAKMTDALQSSPAKIADAAIAALQNSPAKIADAAIMAVQNSADAARTVLPKKPEPVPEAIFVDHS
jgi:fatty-acid desaturase